MRTPRRQSTPIDNANVNVADTVEAAFGARMITPRKRRMIEAYVQHGTIKAASDASGMAQATCKKLIASDVNVRDAISSAVEQASLVSGVTLERVLNEYARIAFSDIGEVVDMLSDHEDPDAALAQLAQLPPDVTAAISKIEISRKVALDGGAETGTFKVHFYDKKSALNDLGRMLALFNDKITITDDSGYGDRLRRAIEHVGATEKDTDT